MQTSETIHPDKSIIKQNPDSFEMGSMVHWEQHEHAVYVFGRNANLAFLFVQDDFIRVKLFFGSQADLNTTAAVIPKPAIQSQVRVDEGLDQLILSTSILTVHLDKDSCMFQIANHEGQSVYEQKEMSWNLRGAVTCKATKTEESHFYGFGEKTGYLDKRDEQYTMWNSDVYAPHVPEIEALYQSIPFFIDFKYGKPCYGIFLDNPGKTKFDMRTSPNTYSFQLETGSLDFYFMYGSTIKEILAQYTQLTGRMPLPPKWAIGYHQSRYSYMSQGEVLELARTFRDKQIPCDGIHLDIHYMDEYRVFTWDQTRFQNPKQMLRELRDMGFRVVPIVDPGVKRDARYTIYREGIERDTFCKKLEGGLFLGQVWPGESAFPDFTDEAVASWWGEKHKSFVDIGISGIWNDMNEPAVFNESKTMDLDVMHVNQGDPKTHEELHNLYGMFMSKATYEGLKKQLKGERPFVLTRAGYAGIQRFAAVWTGDNRSFWEHMAMSIPMVLNLGLSGVPFAGPDIGGFAHHATGELLARWMQMGVFFPYCRNHSAIDTLRQEPWAFGEEVEAICKEYIEMRYRWMPYLYSLFYQASQTGLPIIRPLLLEYPGDQQVFNLCDQFLLGDQVLVAPIYRPAAEVRSVYLPAGGWIDYWTGNFYKGGQHILAHAPLDTLPLFIKAGAILPETTLKQHADDLESESVTINVYANNSEGRNSFELYEDDGRTFEYENGVYNLTQFMVEENQERLQFSYRCLSRSFQTPFKSLRVVFKNLVRTPKAIAGESHMSSWTFDDKRNELIVEMNFEPESQAFHIQF